MLTNKMVEKIVNAMADKIQVLEDKIKVLEDKINKR